MQHPFRKSEFLQLLILCTIVVLFGRWVARLPDRVELGPRLTRLEFTPVDLKADGFAPLRLAGAWKVASKDPRVGGVSALAVSDEDLLALTDSGAVIRFAKPSRKVGTGFVRELPGGPGDPAYKSRRDSEALVRDPLGRGWWVSFENRNELWLFDHWFARTLRRVELGRDRWRRNRGVEAIAAEGAGLILLPEPGDTVLRVSGSSARTFPIENAAGRISDAARLPSGELLILNRRLTPLGFANSLALLERTRSGFRYSRRFALAIGPIDNVEAVAPELLPDGRTRLWLMTDDNFKRPLRTLLIAVDMPAAPKRD